MSRFIALIYREWLEHRAAFVWGPVCVLGLIVLSAMFASGFSDRFTMDLSHQNRLEIEENLGRDADQVNITEALAAHSFDVAGSTDRELADKLSKFLNGVAQPFYWVFLAISFFGFISCIHDERKDRSVLFWKAMPVSDWQSVASKFVFFAWVAPIVTVVAIFLAQLLLLTMSASYVEEGMAGRVWAQSSIIVRPLALILGFFLQALWALPLYAWLMLVSAWATRVPFLWCFGIPIGLIAMEGIVFGTSMLSNAVGQHATLRALPSGTGGLAAQFSVVEQSGFWLGLLVGALMLLATIYLRRRNNEI